MDKLRKIIYASLGYASFRYLAMGPALFKTVIMAIYLGPELLGKYALVILITEYLNYINLGVFYSMSRNVAVALTQRKTDEKINRTFGNAIIFSFLTCLFLLFLLVANTLFPSLFLPEEIVRYFPHIFFLVVSYQLKHFVLRYLQLYEYFFLHGVLEFTAQCINLLLVFLFIQDYLIDAVLLSIIISNSVLALVGFMMTKNISFRFDFRIIKNLISSGSPILLYSVFTLLMTAIDRSMIAFYYKQETALGLYQLGLTLAVGLFTVFRSITFLFQPKWMGYYYQQGDGNKKYIQTLTKQTEFLELCLVALSLIGIVCVVSFSRYCQALDDEVDFLDARQIGPRMEYVKKWTPERWPLAFHSTLLHLIPRKDFSLIEEEMKKIVYQKEGAGSDTT